MAPASVVKIANPATDGTILVLSTNDRLYAAGLFHFDSYNETIPNLFSIYLKWCPSGSIKLYLPAFGLCLRPAFAYYNWTGAPPGSNTLQVILH